ncbi:MAG: hypothetical protein HGJ94_17580 [Desulfosarcina sp.]|nr:hypothetical protein [Desulfosarcina sp.]MBC2744454.1 hypothetical protein [Desulfosarcina sp.]MBC2767362.1 hypothetical protein [Desulfosarcina sp.]
MRSKQCNSAAYTLPSSKRRKSVSSAISTRNFLLSIFAFFEYPGYRAVSILLFGAVAIRTISIAAAFVLFRRHDYIASFRRDFISFFPFKKETICRQPALIEPALKCAATERANFPEAMGIDKDLPFAGVLLMEQVDQFPGRAAVKISCRVHMQVSIALFKRDLKIGAHVFASTIPFG